MKSNRILLVFVIFLILVNCGILGFFWFGAYHQQPQSIPAGPAFEYLSRELHLTPAQKAKYETMRNGHKAFVDSVSEQTSMMRDSFFEQLKKPGVNPAVVNTYGKNISDNMAKIDTATFYHFSRFRKILNTAQQQRFDQVIQNVIHSMGGQGRPPRGRDEDGKPGAAQQGPPERPLDKNGRRLPPPRGERPPPGHPGDEMPPPDGPPPGGRPGPPPGGGPPPDGPPPQ